MLKKIPVDDLRLGMHLHAMCGAWLDHPFWRTKFILDDPADLDKLRASSVKEVWIDVAKGSDVEMPANEGVAPRRDGVAASRAARLTLAVRRRSSIKHVRRTAMLGSPACAFPERPALLVIPKSFRHEKGRKGIPACGGPQPPAANRIFPLNAF